MAREQKELRFGIKRRREESMEKVNGIGGLFFRAKEPEALGRWYRDHLGIPLVPKDYNELSWWQEAGPSAIAPFPETTKYFGDSQKPGWSIFACLTWMPRWRNCAPPESPLRWKKNRTRTDALLAYVIRKAIRLSCGSPLDETRSAKPSWQSEFRGPRAPTLPKAFWSTNPLGTKADKKA